MNAPLFTFLVDFNKLLVPTPDANGMVDPTQSVFNSMFSSFNDAPGGMREELSEVMTSIGVEYSYDDLIAFRTGYFHESGNKGARQYFTTGFGVKLKDLYNIDLAYLIPTKQGNPLANTWRISLNFSIPSKMLRSSVVNGIDEE